MTETKQMPVKEAIDEVWRLRGELGDLERGLLKVIAIHGLDARLRCGIYLLSPAPDDPERLDISVLIETSDDVLVMPLPLGKE